MYIIHVFYGSKSIPTRLFQRYAAAPATLNSPIGTAGRMNKKANKETSKKQPGLFCYGCTLSFKIKVILLMLQKSLVNSPVEIGKSWKISHYLQVVYVSHLVINRISEPSTGWPWQPPGTGAGRDPEGAGRDSAARFVKVGHHPCHLMTILLLMVQKSPSQPPDIYTTL